MTSPIRTHNYNFSIMIVVIIIVVSTACIYRYRWIFYINPNYFGLSSVAFFVLSDFETDCTGDQLECYISSGPYTLDQFFFDEVNPYLHIVVSARMGYS